MGSRILFNYFRGRKYGVARNVKAHENKYPENVVPTARTAGHWFIRDGLTLDLAGHQRIMQELT
jgi:hypothetical protein